MHHRKAATFVAGRSVTGSRLDWLTQRPMAIRGRQTAKFLAETYETASFHVIFTISERRSHDR